MLAFYSAARCLHHRLNVLVVAFLLLLFSCSSAFAGSWQIKYDCSGTETGLFWNNDLLMFEYKTRDWAAPGQTGRLSRFVGVPLGYTNKSTSVDAAIKVTLTWTPSGPGDDPPPELLLKETGGSHWDSSSSDTRDTFSGTAHSTCRCGEVTVPCPRQA